MLTGHIRGCQNDIRIVRTYFKRFSNNKVSRHYWIDTLHPLYIRRHLNNIRNHPSLIHQLQQGYPGYTIKPVHKSDEVYLSVSPHLRKGSDIALSDCHYDAPFSWIPQGGNKFIRMILALNYNDTVYTQVGKTTSTLSTGDFNTIDYNRSYHCVHGVIPDGKYRLLMKLHFVLIPKGRYSRATKFCVELNNWYTHTSRNIMNMSIQPKTFQEHATALLVNTCRVLYNNAYITFVVFVLIVYLVWRRYAYK